MNVIGISGSKGSGKSTAVNGLYALELNELGYKARLDNLGRLSVVTNTETMEEGLLDINDKKVKPFLDETVHPFTKNYNLADALKEFLIYIFGIPYENIYGTDEQKNTPTDIKWSQIPGYFCKDFGAKNQSIEKELGIKYHQDNHLTCRELLQTFGTEICRKIKPDCWTQFTLKRICDEQPQLAIISDVRFIGEIQAIQEVGGKVIRLTRKPFSDTHVSETELDNFDGFDYILDNASLSIADQTTKFLEILCKMGVYKIV